jgi:hypothetical protein
MHILNIDGSFFAQRYLHKLQLTFKENPEKDRKTLIRELVTSLCYEVRNIGTLTHVIFCLDSRSWRKDFKQIYPLTTKKAEDKQSYKKNREGETSYDAEKYYAAYNEFVEIIKTKFNVQVIRAKGAEADDICAITSKQLTSLSPDVFVTAWSSDGDYPQIVSEQISLIKLPKKQVYRPLQKIDTSMMSVFGKKPDRYIQQLIDYCDGQAVYMNPFWVCLYKSILGDAKDNVPCTWTWLSSTGTKTMSISAAMLIKAIEACELTKNDITEDHLYDEDFIKKVYFELIIITKQFARIEGYDKKIIKLADVRALYFNNQSPELPEAHQIIFDAYYTKFVEHLKHSYKVYESNRKMKVLNKKEIPEEVISNIINELKSANGTAKIDILTKTESALQMINLQETSTYFDMFNLDK